MIKLKDIVNDSYSNASGYSLYVALHTNFVSNTPVLLSFEDTLACSTSFLNSSFGQLIEEFGLDKFKSILKISNITKVNGEMIRKYVNSFSVNKLN